MTPFEVTIEKIVAGGSGLARHEGRVVFVPRTAPGERHRVEPVVAKKDFIKAESVVRLETAKARREPPCPYFGRCGGCTVMHLEPEAQLEAKRGILLESLRRAGTSYGGELRLRASRELGYRSRLRFHLAMEGERPVLGFRRRESHQVVDIERCLLASSALNAMWARLRDWAVREPELARHVASVELQESSHRRGRTVARFVVRSPDGISWLEPSRRESLLAETGLDGFVAVAPEGGRSIRAGRPWVRHRALGFTFRQSAGSFFQANRYLLEDLLEAVLPEALVERALDLYCGVGFFALPLAKRAGEVLGVETSPSALRDAARNRRRARAENVRFLREDASRFLRRAELREDDLVLADPPRGGLDRALRHALAESPLRSLRYVSCDPPALARDVAALASHGFRLDELTLLDFFPNTHHFETVAILSRP